MSIFVTKIPQTTRPISELSNKEKQEILSFLKTHPKSRNAIPSMMKKYNISETGLTLLVIEDVMTPKLS